MAGRIRDRSDLPWLVREHGDRVVGYASASPRSDRPAYRRSVDVPVYVAADHRRRGIAGGRYESLLALLRLGGRYAAYAVIVPPSPASVGFHEAVGFERVGLYRRVRHENGEWRDVGPRTRAPRPRGAAVAAAADRGVRGTAAHGEALAAGQELLDG